MDKFPNFEAEKSPEDLATEILKEKGPRSGEFLDWVEKAEAEVVAQNTSRASVDLSTKLAKIYYKAGYADEAIESLSDNRLAASAEGEEVLVEIDSLLDKMETGEKLL